MPEHWDAVVVGAGICGLAAAFELTRRGRRVVVLEAAAVGSGQSAGLARIFRIAHAEPRLCALALEARERWLEWEQVLGVGTLLGHEGLVVAGERAAAHKAAMDAAGAESAALERGDLGARLPLLSEHHPWDAGLWDPLAGSLRIRRTLAALASRVPVRTATVTAIDAGGTVHTPGGALHGDAVLVCAGLGTQPLIAPLGLDLELTVTPHTRVTYEPAGPTACLIAPEAYGLPVGSSGRWALGMDERPDPGWVSALFPTLKPVSELECVSLEAPWLRAGDGFVALRAGRVIALGASNAMKFGPLLGDRLARTALEPGGVHADLDQPS